VYSACKARDSVTSTKYNFRTLYSILLSALDPDASVRTKAFCPASPEAFFESLTLSQHAKTEKRCFSVCICLEGEVITSENAIISLLLATVIPLIGSLIRFAISRKRELLADATGAMLTRYPEGLASALEKIRAYGGKMSTANHATADLIIANPFGISVRGRM
jgi:Zn-dependent protease with chaperone function